MKNKMFHNGICSLFVWIGIVGIIIGLLIEKIYLIPFSSIFITLALFLDWKK